MCIGGGEKGLDIRPGKQAGGSYQKICAVSNLELVVIDLYLSSIKQK